jgi:hypothetical protein
VLIRAAHPYEGQVRAGAKGIAGAVKEVEARNGTNGYRGWNRTSVLLIQSQRGMPATHPVSKVLGSAAGCPRLGYLHPGPVREVRLELTLSRF